MPDSYGKRQRNQVKARKAMAREERRLARARQRAKSAARGEDLDHGEDLNQSEERSP